MRDLAPTALLSRLRFKQLRLVDVLGRTGNLRRTAAELNMTQPAATKILQDLEDTLGVKLFERTPRAMVATEIGTHVVDYARRALTDGERFAGALANLKRGGYGALALGAIMATASDLLPRAIAELKRQRPLMTIQVLATTSDQLIGALGRGELDLVIGRLPTSEDRAKFDFEPLSMEELWAFAAASHPLAGRTHLDLADMGDLPWVLQPAPSPMRRLIDTAFGAAGLRTLDNLVETSSIFATLNLVRHAGMVSMLPSTIVAQEVAGGGFVRLPLEVKGELEPYGIVTRKGVVMTPNAAEFLSILKSLIASKDQEGMSPSGTDGRTRPGANTLSTKRKPVRK
ncbi:LysR family transcriptional regulator [Xanthobacter wiegelii]|uniref:LysR family transcriptional regulator n=1 Tax=Xanthobacter wiegelii TaxID=3119913 RepID=UPI00372CC5CF